MTVYLDAADTHRLVGCVLLFILPKKMRIWLCPPAPKCSSRNNPCTPIVIAQMEISEMKGFNLKFVALLVLWSTAIFGRVTNVRS